MLRSGASNTVFCVLVAAGTAACSSHDDGDAGASSHDASAGRSDGENGATWAFDAPAEAADEDQDAAVPATFASTDPFLDAATVPDASAQPAPMACDADAADEASASYCPPPLSICADRRNLVYFDWGACVSGSCVWPQKAMPCPGTAECLNGGCVSITTAQ